MVKKSEIDKKIMHHLKNIFIIFFIITITVPCFSQSKTDREDNTRRRQDSITYRDDTTVRQEDLISYRDDSIIYRTDTIAYQKELIKYFEDSVYYRFGESINGIYVIRLQDQEYINARIIIDDSPELNISRILGNVAIGSVVIIASIFLPALAPSLPQVLAIIVAGTSTAGVVQAGLAGAAIGAGISGITTYIESGGDPNATFNQAIEGASDGFKWGAVISYGTQLSSVALRVRNATVITTRNQYVGKIHPETGVPFTERIFEYNGRIYKGVFPEFNSYFNATLSNNLFRTSNARQFAECNRQLREAVRSNNQLARSFSSQQLRQISAGQTPEGFVWHHNEIPGRMQLVDFETHFKTGHTGGQFIWGGGSALR